MDRTAPLLTPSSSIPQNAPVATLLAASPAKQREAWTQRLTRWLQLLALTAPPAYLMGYSYHDAWVKALGLVPADFPLATAEYIYEGLLAFSSVVRHVFDFILIRPNVLRNVALEIGGLLLLFLFAYRGTQFVNRRYRAHVQAFRVWLTRNRRKAFERYTPETVVGLAALTTVMIPWLILMVVFFVVLIPFAAGRAGRADALRFWHDLEKSNVLDTFPVVELPDAQGTAAKMHVIDAGTSSYMLYDGQRFIVLRKELLPRQLGAAAPWKP